MNRKHVLALVAVSGAAAFVAGRLTTPAPAHASAGQGVRTMVSFQFVPADGARTRDLLIRGWDTGDIDYIDVSRLPRDADPVRYLWTESGWRFVSQYPPPPGR